MKVHDVEFSEQILERAWEISCENGLSYRSLCDAFIELGYREGDFLSRAADRLLQRKRKAGECYYKHGKWHVVEPPRPEPCPARHS